MKNCVFQHGKDSHRDSAKVALKDSSRSLIWNFLEQIVFLEIGEKVSKVSKLGQFWVQAVCLTTRLRRVIGCLQTRWLDASKPLVLAGAVPSGGFFRQKRRLKVKECVYITKLMYLCDLLCIHKRISCVYTTDLLCMHNTLVHALGQGPQGPGTQKRRWAGPQ